MMENSTQQEARTPEAQGVQQKRPPFQLHFTEKVIDALQTGNTPWQKSQADQEPAPANPESKTLYRGVNLINLALEGKKDPRWMTLLQANNADMTIKRGSKATPIVYYQYSKDEKKLDAYGKPAYDQNGKVETQKVIFDKPILRTAYVFNASQIEGIPPLEAAEKPLADKTDAIERTEALLAASGAAFLHDQKDRSFYDRQNDIIRMQPPEDFATPEKYLAEKIHQLTHWTSHESRLDRQSGPNGTTARNREELRSEIASWMIGRELGLADNTHAEHEHHVQGYVSLLQKDPYEIMRLTRDAENIRGFVLGLEHQKEVSQELDQDKELDRGPKTVAVGMPTQDLEGMQTLPPEKEFAAALEKAGLDLGGRPVVMDGVTQVVDNGAYSATLGPVPEGVIRNNDTGVKIDWAATGHVLSSDALKTQREAAQTMRQENKVSRESKRERKHEKEQEKEQKSIPVPPKGRSKDRGLSL